MFLVELLLVCGLALWLVLSLLHQLPLSWKFKANRYDYFELIPDWKLFAPRPITHDFTLAYRDRLVDGNMTTWKKAHSALVHGGRTALWHPEKRRKKTLLSVIRSLIKLHDEHQSVHGDDALQVSTPYITLLHLVSHLPHHDEAVATQFAVYKTAGFWVEEKAKVVLHSRFHPLVFA